MTDQDIVDFVRLRRRSAVLAALTRAVMILLPLAVVLYGELAPAFDLLTIAKVPWVAVATFDPATVEPWQRHAGVGVALVSVVLLVVGLHHLHRCFANFARGQALTRENARHFSRFGAWIAAAVVASFVATPVLSVLFTLGMPAGQRQLAIGLDSNQLVALLVAGGAWIVGAIMAEGARAAEENAQFV
ncbi:DUF2975 domain-containing protein [Zavarzinia aquatilis]|uniref:DUF2975 domain-containing protein n=1 Tax=Zavarzinia aquatilis TaxID=2211142 RepID=A0A317E6A0_9PROT|nr:DUF2975 domain-containing protein [Zavarzinia aquatilis]PWR22628.1 hypothetical protein DKG74_12220 [Zavarzinia aquatilis]